MYTNGGLATRITDMITEVRHQCKHGVDFIKMADSTRGDVQTMAPEELRAVNR